MVNSAIFTIVFVCIIAIVARTVNSQKTNMEVASKEKTETMQEQEEQGLPKALTEITAREPNTNNFTYVTSEDNIKVPVPKGYVASTDAEERYVNGITTDGVREHHGGFVIYEKNAGETAEEATEAIAANLNTAKTNRNQWVWVPISSTEVSNMYHVTNGQIYGNKYNFTSNGYSIQTSIAREPSVLRIDTYYKEDMDNGRLSIFFPGISRGKFLQEMREEFYNMLVSVKTYGGFYIGRYETSINDEVANIIKGSYNIARRGEWETQYRVNKRIKGANKSVQTGIIWGIQYDETLKWIIDSGEKTCYEVASDSSSWSGVMRNGAYFSGDRENAKANNIYDLAGNVYEWTMRGTI